MKKLLYIFLLFFITNCQAEYAGGYVSNCNENGYSHYTIVDIVMTGDSVSKGMSENPPYPAVDTTPMTYYKTNFTYLKTVNTGVGGNCWSDLYARFETDVVEYKPKAVFIHLGVNCLGNASTDTVAENLIYLNGIKSKCDLNSIKLCIAEILPYGTIDTGQDAKIDAWNTDLASWCTTNKVTLLECHDSFLADGSDVRPEPTYLADEWLHPNDLGNSVVGSAYYTSYQYRR